MRVIGCVSVFNEVLMLADVLAALKPHVDMTVVADGPYRAFPHHRPASDDGTLDIAHELADVLITKARPWIDQVEKRNSYLIGSEGDWYFVIDGDEIVEGELDREKLTGEHGHMVMLEQPDIPDRPVFRLFRHRRSLAYTHTHTLLWSPETGYIRPDEHPVIDGLRIRHRNMERPQERVKDKGVWLRWQKEHEREARSRFHL